MNIFAGNALWQLVEQSDAISKFILLLLLCMSIACWAIFIGKLALFHLKERQFKTINKLAHKAKSMTDLADICTAAPTTTPGYFIAKNLSFLKELSQHNPFHKVNQFDWELFERNIDNTTEAILIQCEEYISFLSTCAAVGPLLGLFGTIWGLIHSFMRISESQIADIATIAPGIAEALIVTIAGLVVAIPALIMFNYLQLKARRVEHLLIELADRITFIAQQMRER
jgi:biopolymer transport protein TolQ